MIVDVSTILDCSAAKAWNEVQKSSLLLHVIWPLARVVGTGAPFPERWSEGLRIQCRFFVFVVIPIGVHTILIEKIDQKNYEIQSREHAARPGKAGDQSQADGVFADEEDNRDRRGRSFSRKRSRVDQRGDHGHASPDQVSYE
jgi:hypothetical protein